MGSPDSRARCFRACYGVYDRAGSVRFSPYRCAPCCLLLTSTVSAPWNQAPFHGSIAGPHVPLSTLHPGPCGPQRMTQGQRGSLCLHRMTLSFTTPRRFSSALSDVGSNATWRRMKKEAYFPSLLGGPVPPYQFHPLPHLSLLDLVIQCTSQTPTTTGFRG